MKIVQRIETSHNNEEVHKLLLDAVDKYPGSFTDVWLSSPVGFPKNETHREYADEMVEQAKRYKEKGIRVAVQISNTVGHGVSESAGDYSGVVYDGSPVQGTVGFNGERTICAYCWNNEAFRKYLAEHIEYYAATVKPDEIWFDDDLHNARDDIKFGCFCDNCVAKFNAMYGTNYTPQELGHEFAYGDLKVREQYVEFVSKSLADFAGMLASVIHKASPDTVVCLESGLRYYDVPGIIDAIYKATGKPPMYRTGGSVYRDHNPSIFLMKMQFVSWQHALLPEYVTQRCPEIENIPYTSMGKTMYGTAMETTLHLAAGATGITFDMLVPYTEPSGLIEKPEFYERAFEMFSRLRPYWDHLAEVSGKTISGGMLSAAPKKLYMLKMKEGDAPTSFGRMCFNEFPELLRTGIPVDYEASPDGAYILHPNVAAQMDDSEIRALLSKNVFTDAKTLIDLKARGIDLGVEAHVCSVRESCTFTEHYTDHPAAKAQDCVMGFGSYYPRAYDICNITAMPEGSEVVSTYTFADIKEPISKIEGAPFGCASVILNLPEGGKWAVVSSYGFGKGYLSTARRDFYLDLIDYISDKAPGARAVGPLQNYLMPRVSKETGKTLAVSYLNCTIEPQEDIPLIIRRPETERFVLSRQFKEDIILPFTKNGDEYTVHIPALPAWDIATVFCDK